MLAEAGDCQRGRWQGRSWHELLKPNPNRLCLPGHHGPEAGHGANEVPIGDGDAAQEIDVVASRGGVASQDVSPAITLEVVDARPASETLAGLP